MPSPIGGSSSFKRYYSRNSTCTTWLWSALYLCTVIIETQVINVSPLMLLSLVLRLHARGLEGLEVFSCYMSAKIT